MWEPKDEVLDESSLALIGNTSGQTVGWSGDLNPRRFRSRLATTRELSHSGSITIAFPGAQTALEHYLGQCGCGIPPFAQKWKDDGWREDHSRRDSGSDTMMLTSNAPPSASTPAQRDFPKPSPGNQKGQHRHGRQQTACPRVGRRNSLSYC